MEFTYKNTEVLLKSHPGQGLNGKKKNTLKSILRSTSGAAEVIHRFLRKVEELLAVFDIIYYSRRCEAVRYYLYFLVNTADGFIDLMVDPVEAGSKKRGRTSNYMETAAAILGVYISVGDSLPKRRTRKTTVLDILGTRV